MVNQPMDTLERGENRPAPGERLAVTVASSAPVDVSALLLGAGGKVRSDADFVFFNQPVGPGVSYRHGNGQPDVVDVQTTALPADIERVVITASLDGTGPTTFGSVGSVTATIMADHGGLSFPITGLGAETALVCVEIYRRGGAWKVRAVGQGYANGLAGIATDFGVTIDDPAPTAPQPPAASVRTPNTVVPQHYSPPPASFPPQHPSPPAPPGNQPPPPPYPPQPLPYSPRGAQPMHSELFNPQHAEVTGVGIQKQGHKMAKVTVAGEVLARAGSMVAYQGDLHFEALGSGGIGRAIQRHLTGEGVPLMKVSGRGDLFLANAAADVHLIDLDGTDGLTINGANVLGFDSTLRYDVRMVQGAAGIVSNAGLFNCVFTGRGRIAITTHGAPVVLQVDQPTYADPQAAVAWSSSLHTGIKRNDSFGFGRIFLGRTTGEGITLSFSGQGFVIVQPSELPPGGFFAGRGEGQRSGETGNFLGGLFG